MESTIVLSIMRTLTSHSVPKRLFNLLLHAVSMARVSPSHIHAFPTLW